MPEIFSLHAIFRQDDKSYAQLKKARTEQNRGVYGRSFWTDFPVPWSLVFEGIG